MTGEEKRDIMDMIDNRMREVTSMIGSIEKSFTSLKDYLEKLVAQQNAETTRLRDIMADLYEKRTELIATVNENDKKVAAEMTELDKRLVSMEKDVASVKETLASAVDSKRFTWTTIGSYLGLAVMVLLYLLEKIPGGK